MKGRVYPAVPPWLGVALGCAAAGGIAIRRLRPHIALAMTTGASAALTILGFGAGSGQMLVAAVPVYIVALVKPVRPARVALASVVAALLVVVVLTPAPPTLPQANGIQGVMHAVPPGTIVIATWVVGRAIRSSRAAHEREAQMMVQTERLRIARELHDMLAHSMSVIAVQAGVGRYLVREQPQEAEKSLAAIETTSRTTLTEMRRLMGVLREDKPGDLVPTPSIANLPELTEQTRRAGLTVDLTVKDVPEELPAGVGLAAFRIVQEALTNVIKHAGTDRSRVEITYIDGELSIQVTDQGNGPTGAPGGHGLAGMRERVALYGGQFEAGPMPHRGFRVAARLPA
ncbi:sensor histidine kinase [Streptomyces sp. NPDC059467]|uniref:sensor histidine kinase n=1 Tax=Streptomyces sp. NPDC059467 TaxID=3346844 RepID=UPI0036D10EC4